MKRTFQQANQQAGIIKFQAIGEKSFTIHKLPIVCGSEHTQKWTKLRRDTTIDPQNMLLYGHCVIAPLDQNYPCELKTHQIKTRLAFTRDTSFVQKYHFILIQKQDQFYVQALAPFGLNKTILTEKDGLTLVKQNDLFVFERGSTLMPLAYHIQVKLCDDIFKEEQKVLKIFKPLIDKCDPRLQTYIDMIEQKDPQAKQWQLSALDKLQCIALKRALLYFGYGRWSKIRAVSTKTDQILANLTDQQLRPHANLFMLALAQQVEHLPRLQKGLLALVQICETTDFKVRANAYDFMQKGQTIQQFKREAPSYAKRILCLSRVTNLMRDYERAKALNPDVALLSFLTSKSLVELEKPVRPNGGLWTRKHDEQLIKQAHENGLINFPDDQVIRLQDLTQLIVSKPRPLEFRERVFEASGFNYQEKLKIYEILTTYGIPMFTQNNTCQEESKQAINTNSKDTPPVTFGEIKEDWNLLKAILDKQMYGEEEMPDLASAEMLEKFVNQMDAVSSRMIKDYSEPVNKILQNGIEETSNDSQSDEDPELRTNDFHLNTDMLKAAEIFEKTSTFRVYFDPDGDNFNFGYEMALTLKQRLCMLKLIRKEILSHGGRMWDKLLPTIQEQFGQSTQLKLARLPESWLVDVHDKGLLAAMRDHGLSYLGKLKNNQDYGFQGISISRKKLLIRVEKLCFFFKNQLSDYKKIHCPNLAAVSRPGDKSTGRTRLIGSCNQKIKNVSLERDSQNNIKYPIFITPTLSILSLGIVDFERPAYHSSKNIFPIGFKSLRKTTSMFELGKQVEYINEILDGGQKPLFKVTCMEDPDNPLTSESASGVWIDICKKINNMSENRRQNVTVSGPDRYGIAEPGVSQLLAMLPNADKCTRFKPPAVC